MKTLYILRHAKAELGKDGQEDSERTLSERGREACASIGAYVREKSYTPSLVLCSPAARTRETYELAMQAAEISPTVRYEKGIYLASPTTLLQLIQGTDNNQDSLLIVGHNPAMHQLAFSLAQPANTVLYKGLMTKYSTGTLTVLCFPVDSWQDIAQGKGNLIDVRSPAAS